MLFNVANLLLCSQCDVVPGEGIFDWSYVCDTQNKQKGGGRKGGEGREGGHPRPPFV